MREINEKKIITTVIYKSVYIAPRLVISEFTTPYEIRKQVKKLLTQVILS